jgi:hypothetical protein
MSYDSSLGIFVDDKISSTEIVKNIDNLQRGLNGGYGFYDFDVGLLEESYDGRVVGGLKTEHILKPEFYGSPSPRVEMVTNDVHYRRRSNNYLDRYYRHEHLGFDESTNRVERFTAYQPIEGLSCTFTCREKPKSVEVVVCLHAYESEGEPGGTTSTDSYVTDNYSRPFFHPSFVSQSSFAGWEKAQALNNIVAELKMFAKTPLIDEPMKISGTTRFIRCRGRDRYNSNRVQIRLHHIFTASGSTTHPSIQQGVNNISYQCRYVLPDPDGNKRKHIIFESRSMIVNVNYK